MAKLKDLLTELIKRREVVFAGGGQEKAEARHAKGQMTARERLLSLFTPHTFQEMGMHVQHETRHFGMSERELPGDGVITGIGYVDGRPVAAFSQDFTIAGGSLGKVHADKICDVMDYAGRTGMPIVGFNDSGGARIQEGVESLSGYGKVFNRNILMSGVVPQIAIIAGPCAGGASYSPALMDFIIMTRTNASMFICGPDVIKAATGEGDDDGGNRRRGRPCHGERQYSLCGRGRPPRHRHRPPPFVLSAVQQRDGFAPSSDRRSAARGR